MIRRGRGLTSDEQGAGGGGTPVGPVRCCYLFSGCAFTVLISLKVFIKSLCKSQFPHIFVNLSFRQVNKRIIRQICGVVDFEDDAEEVVPPSVDEEHLLREHVQTVIGVYFATTDPLDNSSTGSCADRYRSRFKNTYAI